MPRLSQSGCEFDFCCLYIYFSLNWYWHFILFFPANGVRDHTASQYLHQRYQTITVLVAGLLLFETIAFPRATHPSAVFVTEDPRPSLTMEWASRYSTREVSCTLLSRGTLVGPVRQSLPEGTKYIYICIFIYIYMWNSPFVPFFSTLFILHVICGKVLTTSEPLETPLRLHHEKYAVQRCPHGSVYRSLILTDSESLFGTPWAWLQSSHTQVQVSV